MSIRTRIAEWLAEATAGNADEIAGWLEKPPQPELGDYAFPCFRLAKQLRRPPAIIAADLAARAGEAAGFLEKAEAVGGYLNLHLRRSLYISEVVNEVLERGDRCLRGTAGDGKTIVLDYSSPNIAKQFHVGHAFSTILGHVLYRLFDNQGYRVVRMNHLGDHGTQFGKLIVAYRRWGDRQAFAERPIDELQRVYALFGRAAESEPELEDEARLAFSQLEAGDPKALRMWSDFRAKSLAEFMTTYNRLGIGFDNTNGESFYSRFVPGVVDWLDELGLLELSEGAQVVRLNAFDLPPCMIVKSNGTSTYASRDLAAIRYRLDTYAYDQNIYVVDARQNLHFQQIFAVMRRAGETARNVHVSYGAVKGEDGLILSSRGGGVIYLNELLDESVEKTRAIVRANNDTRGSELSDAEIETIAETVGLGAIFFTFVRNSRERDIIFSWERMLDFDGDTAPYIQYTYARARSILRKAGNTASTDGLDLLGSDEELALARLMAGLPDAAAKAAEIYEPYLLSRQLAQLARAFNKYYNLESILGTADERLRNGRLRLLEAVCLALRRGLDLLGIGVVERM